MPRGSDYAELLAQVRSAGLLERRPLAYAVRIGTVLALFVAGWALFLWIGDSWWQLAVAGFLAAVFAQLGFLGHEAGHHQIFGNRRADQLVGLLVGNLLIGLAFHWWVDKHRRHHAHPNTKGLDPDIAGDVIVFTVEPGRDRRGFGRVFTRHQGQLFFPLMLLEAAALHLAGVRALMRAGYRDRWREAALLAVHTGLYLTAVVVVLSPLRAVLFVVVHQGLFGVYLGCSFAPNHKGMPMLEAKDETDFLRRQVLTARNVRGGRVMEFLLGGLNHQIEHHLFPGMPTASLRRAAPIVRAFCAEHGLPYAETGLFDSYRLASRHLTDVGRAMT